MHSKLDLCSMALLKLGEPPINSLSDNTPASQLSRTLFDSITDSMLALHPWNFATCEITLTKNSDGNFLVPANVLRILKTNGQLCGNRIYSDSDKINITAVTRIDCTEYPCYFASLVTTRLAMEFCIPLCGDTSIFRTLAALYESDLQSAKFTDSTSSVPQGIRDFSLLDSRF